MNSPIAKFFAEDAFKALVEAGPYSAEQARANGLVDRIGQVEEAEAALKDYQAQLERAFTETQAAAKEFKV